MPKAIKHRRATPISRKSIRTRSDEKKPRCKGSVRAKEDSPKIIADSIYSLSVSSIIGMERFIKVEGKKKVGWEKDYRVLCNDLLACTQNALKILTGEESKFNPIDAGLSIETAFTYVINVFEHQILPKGFMYNIDECEFTNEFYFTVYKEDEPFGDWMCFEIKPIIKKLKYDNRLCDIFIRFLNRFSSKTQIGLWWDNSMGDVECWIQDHIENMMDPDSFESEEDYYQRKYELQETLEQYQGTGEQYRIMQLIKNSMYYTPEDLIDEIDYYLNLKFYRKNKRIANWIKEACEFMKLNGCIEDFVYRQEYDEGIMLEEQYNFIWDAEDEYTRFHENTLNDMANGCGIISPRINYQIKKDTTKIDWAEFEERSKWIDKIYPLWKSYDELINSLKPKKRNGR